MYWYIFFSPEYYFVWFVTIILDESGDRKKEKKYNFVDCVHLISLNRHSEVLCELEQKKKKHSD